MGRKPAVGDLRSIQRKEALDRAVRLRTERKVIREKLRAGVIDPIKMIEGNYTEVEDTIKGWRIGKVLLSVPMIGPYRAGEILRVFGRKGDVRMGDLTFAQRKHLALLVREAREVVVDVA